MTPEDTSFSSEEMKTALSAWRPFFLVAAAALLAAVLAWVAI